MVCGSVEGWGASGGNLRIFFQSSRYPSSRFLKLKAPMAKSGVGLVIKSLSGHRNAGQEIDAENMVKMWLKCMCNVTVLKDIAKSIMCSDPIDRQNGRKRQNLAAAPYFPGNWMWQPTAWGISRGIPRLRIRFPAQFPGELRGFRFPGKFPGRFPGKLAAHPRNFPGNSPAGGFLGKFHGELDAQRFVFRWVSRGVS